MLLSYHQPGAEQLHDSRESFDVRVAVPQSGALHLLQFRPQRHMDAELGHSDLYFVLFLSNPFNSLPPIRMMNPIPALASWPDFAPR